MNDSYYLHYLNLLTEIGPAGLWKLKHKFTKFQLATQASLAELEQAGLSSKLARTVFEHCQQLTEQVLNNEQNKLLQSDIGLCSFNDSNYPQQLREIAVPPLLLYVRVRATTTKSARQSMHCLSSGTNVAVVGTRQCSSYGVAVTKQIVQELCASGITIVSGLAFGIDTVAHRTALASAANSSTTGSTIAVLPGGIDNESIYPASNIGLANEIMKAGCIVSEQPPGSKIFKGSFLARNRIIAGLCQGVVVTECGQKSGALMTAKYATEENRNVYAVPGSIFSATSQGTNWLIQQGATLVPNTKTIIDDLGIQQLAGNPQTVDSSMGNLSEAEKVVLQYIHSGQNTPSKLIAAMSKAKTEPGQTLAVLSQLELGNWVGRELNGSYFIKKYYE